MMLFPVLSVMGNDCTASKTYESVLQSVVAVIVFVTFLFQQLFLRLMMHCKISAKEVCLNKDYL
jgi:hypothetical protein